MHSRYTSKQHCSIGPKPQSGEPYVSYSTSLPMRKLLGLLLAVGLTDSTRGGTFTNESPNSLQGIKIIWAVPTNVWPVHNIWSYKVVPQNFSDSIISNAMVIGAFSMSDKRVLPAEALEIDEKAVCFSNKDKTKWLEILPTLGYIKYYDQNAEAKTISKVKDVPEPVVGVPGKAKATRLGLKYARLLGVDASQLAKRTGTSDFDLHWEITRRQWTDPKTQKQIDEIQGFGIDFTRCIDGIEISGFGDVHVSFGNNAKIQELEISWRNLQRCQLLDNFVSSQQIVKSIANGHTPLPNLAGWPIEEIKTLTITNAAPRYSRRPGDEPMDFVVPALQLDAVIDNGKTNKYIWFQTGIFSDSGK